MFHGRIWGHSNFIAFQTHRVSATQDIPKKQNFSEVSHSELVMDVVEGRCVHVEEREVILQTLKSMTTVQVEIQHCQQANDG